MPDESTGGPFLNVAVLCEKILQEKDGVLSIIRMIDRVQVEGSAEEMPPIPFQCFVVVALKAGIARGKYTIKITPHSPSGVRLPAAELPALLEGEDRGAGVVFNLNIEIREEGLYWFEVQVQDVLVTKIPLRFVYQRLVTGVSRS
jgi:hypothetical protein